MMHAVSHCCNFVTNHNDKFIPCFIRNTYLPSRHTTSFQRQYGVVQHCTALYDVVLTLKRRHVFTGRKKVDNSNKKRVRLPISEHIYSLCITLFSLCVK